MPKKLLLKHVLTTFSYSIKTNIYLFFVMN